MAGRGWVRQGASDALTGGMDAERHSAAEVVPRDPEGDGRPGAGRRAALTARTIATLPPNGSTARGTGRPRPWLNDVGQTGSPVRISRSRSGRRRPGR
jgi:hypothetical protein